MKRIDASRREFLRSTAALSTLGAGSGFALNLATIGAAAAQPVGNDYKAIVCLFMFGGNDSHNMVIPCDAQSYAGYKQARDVQPTPVFLDLPGTGTNPARAISPRHANLPDASASPNAGRPFALHPALAKIQALFDGTATGNAIPPGARPAAIVANVGPLIQPTRRSDMNVRGFALPPRLFSHNDQQSTWMAFGPEGAASTGWGGRMGDLLMSANSEPVFTCISLAGNTVFLSGRDAVQYQMSSGGVASINALAGNSGTSVALNAMLTEGRQNLFEREQVRVTTRAIRAREVAFDAFNTTNTIDALLPGGGVNGQLRAVARMIAGRGRTGARRQVFFVSMGGFDNHDFLLEAYGGSHGRGAGLMAALDNAVDGFYRAMTTLGLADQVTMFTASDFGRTLTSNGDGSDHGWGAHHFVVGGAVRGGDIYGRFPVVGVGGPAANDEVGQGRLLPGMSVDQMAASLGRWFGVSDADLLTILPNLKNFGTGGTPTAVVADAIKQISLLG